MPPFEVQFYQKPDGSIPARAFLEALDVKMRAKMVRTIQLLEANGPMLREPYSKPLGEGLFELRAQVGTDITRVLYFFIVNRRIILTNGFVKKTQKTPPAEIDRAMQYRNEYMGREGTHP